MEIVHNKEKDELRFIALTDRARAEESLTTGQLHLVEDLIRHTIADTRRDPKVTHALFEMLIPNRLKEPTPNQYDVVLVADEVSGSSHWRTPPTWWAILAGLHGVGYRILHLAGHGVHEQEFPLMDTSGSCEACERPFIPQTKKVSGMVIGDKVYLTPGDVEQMRWVPELVFINCCHLGSVAPRDATDRPRLFHRLAANIAAQFIRMGVKAVVAAGWAVDAAAAETFAISFYRHLLASDKFGDAVRAAREETFDQHVTTNTWGAYQCDGDPDFRPRPRKPGKESVPRRNYVSLMHVVTDLENLTNRECLGADCGNEVDAVVQAVKDKEEKWLGRPEVAAALGLAYGELCLFKQAI